MEQEYTIGQLTKNRALFSALLLATSEDEFRWRPKPNKWNLLDIICHLYDEEREDFKQRTKSVLEDPSKPLPLFDPTLWVTERRYSEQDFNLKLEDFLQERQRSIEWLNSLKNPQWENEYLHPKMGPLSAKFFLSNWLAHDYLHIRQILHLKHLYLKKFHEDDLDYAGIW